MLYFSYGMNTNLNQMATRCPTAKSLGRAELQNYRFEFKRHATIEPDSGRMTYGVLWDITQADEKSLDMLEGYPLYYTKKNVTVMHEGKQLTAMTYLMYPDEQLHIPADSYYQMLEEGYQEHGVPITQIKNALRRTIIN